MVLSWNEIKERAINFSREWADTSNEEADAKPFLVEFFNILGISSRKVSSFEHKVKKLNEKNGYIDLLWKGNILIEMKSRGKNLDKAYQQAKDYLHGLKDNELPKYILVSDFENFRLYDLEEDNIIEFKLNELVHNIQHFAYLLGYQKKIYKEQDPANIKAAELMGELHDRLKEIGYTGHALEVYLVRLLFCLFAEDTTIFEKDQFQDFILQRTSPDASDLASRLSEFFQVLNTPTENRFKNIDEQLNNFPYINGKLFEENLPTASFDSKMRNSLLTACSLDWAKISPAIFGSMFQSVMNPEERRNLGAHYTSETNILKLIKSLFLDDLWLEFEKIKNSKNKLIDFHKKISSLKFLDPACGCGNFLVITYRELRLLELEILRALYKSGQQVIDVREIIWLDVDIMYGIEYEEFPARIAEVAMWLIDHQMNMLISKEFGQYFVRLPLKKSANIIHVNALQADWESIISKNQLSYILGNPPFVGSRIMNKQQKQDLIQVFDNAKAVSELDYVTAWYIKSAKYIQNTNIKVAFVSTNSITQGLQTSILWGILLNKYKIKIFFAHRTFKWKNEAKGNAAVYCVIIGFYALSKPPNPLERGNLKDQVNSQDVKQIGSNSETLSTNKLEGLTSSELPLSRGLGGDKLKLYEYTSPTAEPTETIVKHINPYLVEGSDLLIERRQNPICDVPEMCFGNMPADGGEFLFTNEEKLSFVEKEPESASYFKEIISAREFLNNEKRWCLWLESIEPSELRKLKEVKKRVEKVKIIRENSSRPQLANTPHLFAQITQPKNTDYILIPRVSSENRKYIPMGFVNKNCIASDSCLIIPNGTLYHFGILTSAMHMAWVKYICGRLESRFRYSKDIVYNNFPFPKPPSSLEKGNLKESANSKNIKQISNNSKTPTYKGAGGFIEKLAQKVLDVRGKYPDSSLADLYDPLTMPPDLVKAHNELDKAVDLLYRPQPFTSEANRMEFLFELYEKYTANLFTEEKPKKKKNSKAAP